MNPTQPATHGRRSTVTNPPSIPPRTRSALALILAVFAFAGPTRADDWPQWMGPRRDGIWRETGILEQFPDGGPKILWRAPVNPGYCGPAVVGDRLYLLDRAAGKMPERRRGDRTLPMVPGNERILCLDARTGAKLWEHTNDCAYRISYPSGPRATPLVEGGRVYTLGAMGDLRCLDASSGAVQWHVNFTTQYALAEPPAWGWSAHPLLDGDRLICTVGGSNSAVVAFHKNTGKELWRSLSAVEIGYAPPMIHEVGGQRQLVVWHPDAVSALKPGTGEVLWTLKYPFEGKPMRPEVTIAAPRFDANRLFLTEFYQGSALLELSAQPPGAKVLWNRRSRKQSEFDEGLHTTMSTPLFLGDWIYGVCGFGELRCLEAKTGDRKWETYAATGGQQGLFANAFLVQNGDRVFLWNDQGELILARLKPSGFEEISRAKLLDTTENTRGRDVLWCHPAFANRRAWMHNGKELICVDLARQ